MRSSWILTVLLVPLILRPVQAFATDLPPAFAEALVALEAKDCPAALKAFEATPDPFPESIRGRVEFLTGFCLLKTDRPADALPILERAATEYDLLADYAMSSAAQAAVSLADHSRAVALLTRLLARFPHSRLAEEAQFRLAKAHIDMEQHEEAEKALGTFLDRYPASTRGPEAALLLGQLFLEMDRPREAIPLLKRLYTLFPTDPAAGAAERLLREIPDRAIITPEDDLVRAKALFQGDRYSEAAAALAPLVQRDPADGEIRLLLGRSLFALKEYGRVITTLLPLAEPPLVSPLQVEALFLVGRASLRSGDTLQSIAYLERIPSESPHNSLAGDALYLIGLNHEEQGEADAALEVYDRLLRRYPHGGLGDTALWRRAWLFYRQGALPQASDELARLLEAYPQSPRKPQALYWRGRLLEQLGKDTPARAMYRRLLKDAVNDPYYLQAARQRLGLKSEKLFRNPLFLPAGTPPDAVIKARELSFLRLWDEAAAEYWEIAGAHPRDIPLQWEACEALARANQFDRVISLAWRTVRTLRNARGQEKVLAAFWTFLYPRAFWPWVDQYARETRLDPYLVTALIREESAFAPTALSKAGARGLMQLLPSTAARVARDANLLSPVDLEIPGANIALGTRYLAQLRQEFEGNVILTLAAYNAGPHVVRRWLADHRPLQDLEAFVEEIPYPETQRYVKRVLGSYDRYLTLYGETQ